MAKARQLMGRRKTVRNIRTITRTMEMVAASRFHKYHDLQAKAQVMRRRLEEILPQVWSAAGLSSQPGAAVPHPEALLREPGNGPVELLVITSDRGLCGGYNNRVLEVAYRAMTDLRREGRDVRLHVIGKKGATAMRYRLAPGTDQLAFPKPAHTRLALAEKDIYGQVRDLAAEQIAAVRSGTFSAVYVASMRMVSKSLNRPGVTRLLPLPRPENLPPPEKLADQTAVAQDVDFVPDRAAVLAELLPMVAQLELYAIFLEALLTEQLSRMAAMRSATGNAEDMIRALGVRINRARQGQITTELAEIVGGAAALTE